MRTDEEAPSPFVGRWVGETQGCESPAHIWEIRQGWGGLWIQTHWEGETTHSSQYGELVEGQLAFTLQGDQRTFTATLVDPQHFVIPRWDTNDIRGGEGPDYDVVFSRPGLAELTARAAYVKFLGARSEE